MVALKKVDVSQRTEDSSLGYRSPSSLYLSLSPCPSMAHPLTFFPISRHRQSDHFNGLLPPFFLPHLPYLHWPIMQIALFLGRRGHHTRDRRQEKGGGGRRRRRRERAEFPYLSQGGGGARPPLLSSLPRTLVSVVVIVGVGGGSGLRHRPPAENYRNI